MDGGEAVVVTGFGPFRQYLVNPSWEAAQEIPVSYAGTRRMVREMWERVNPQFAVHLGLARGSGAIILEQTGKNGPYRDRDVRGSCPEGYCCVQGGPDQLDSVVDMRAVSKRHKRAGMDVIYSRDAGRYLCDFAYYCSLYHGRRRAALIHVPSSGDLASADRLVPLLQTLIETMLSQLKDSSETA